MQLHQKSVNEIININIPIFPSYTFFPANSKEDISPQVKMRRFIGVIFAEPAHQSWPWLYKLQWLINIS